MKKRASSIFYGMTQPRYILFFFLFVSCVICIIVSVFPNNDSVNINNETTKSFNTQWFLENEGIIIDLPYLYDTYEGNDVTISKEIEDVFESSAMSISMTSYQQSVIIKVDDDIIYTYSVHEDKYWNVNPPPAWHIVRLSPKMIGKTISITYNSPIKNSSGVISGIEVGSKYANVTSFFSVKFASLLICFFIFSFGIFAVMMYFIIKDKISALHGILYLGLFSILISLWSACETKAMQIFTGNVQLIMFTTYISIILSPIPLLLLFRDRFKGEIFRNYNRAITLFSCFFILIIGLQIYNVAPFNNLFFVFLCCYILIFVFVAITLYLKYREDPSNKNLLPFMGVAFLVMFGAIDIYRYFVMNLYITSNYDTSAYFRIGIMLFIFTMGYATLNQIIEYYTESTKANTYKELAHRDSLSGLYNRAFLSEVYPRIFKNAIRNNQDFSVIMLDIDNFKNYNDNYGHALGDEAIISVSNILEKIVCRPLDAVIRYGGEEFLVVLPSIGLEGATIIAQKIHKEFNRIKILHEFSNVDRYITISQGIYSAVPKLGSNLDKFINCADKALYQAKNQGKNKYCIFKEEYEDKKNSFKTQTK